jgi:hypothetical protein
VGLVIKIVGGTVSSRTTTVCGADVLPALSVAVNVTVVTPSAVIGMEAVGAKTSVEPIGWAPVAL